MATHMVDIKRCGHRDHGRIGEWIKHQLLRFPRQPVLIVCRSDIATFFTQFIYQHHHVSWVDPHYPKNNGVAFHLVRAIYPHNTVVLICGKPALRVFKLLKVRGHLDDPAVLEISEEVFV